MANGGGHTRSLSYSEITTALRCFASWDMSYSDTLAGSSLKKREVAPILTDGRAWGAGVATWHATGDLFAASAALTTSLVDDFTAMRARGHNAEADQLASSLNELSGILDHYVANSMRMESLESLEDEIIVRLPGREGARASNKYRFQCFLDGFEPDYRGHPAIVEFKLRGQLTDAAVISKSPQYRWYAWAYARKIGWDGPVTVVIDERLKEAPKPARLIKAAAKDVRCPVCHSAPEFPCSDLETSAVIRSYHPERKEQMTVSKAVDQVTTPELYEQACFDHSALIDNGVLFALRQRKWSQRIPLTFTPAELEEAGRELVSAGRLIHQLDTGTLYPIRNGNAQNCRGCRFKDICDEPSNTFAVNALFERNPPKRER